MELISQIEKLILTGSVEYNGYKLSSKKIVAKIGGAKSIEIDLEIPISGGIANMLRPTLDKITIQKRKILLSINRSPDKTIVHKCDISILRDIVIKGSHDFGSFVIESGPLDIEILEYHGVMVKFLTTVKIKIKKIGKFNTDKTILLYGVLLKKDMIEVNTSVGVFPFNREEIINAI